MRNAALSATATSRVLALLVACLALAGAALARAEAAAPLVAVAANMSEAARSLAERFAERSGIRVRMSVGSSGNLARQILRGAPFELFISADEDRPRRLHRAGHTEGPGHVYAFGRLALYLPHGSPLALPGAGADTVDGMAGSLSPEAIARFAVANPEHAPYGRAAREVLRHLGRWSSLEPKLVMGENAVQAARFARSGGVQGALLPLSLVRAPGLHEHGRHLLVPRGWHTPIRQRMVLLRGAGDGARAFYRFLRGEEAAAILEAAGYESPAAG